MANRSKGKKGSDRKGSFNRDNSSKQMRRDSEIEGTAKREFRDDRRRYDSSSNDPRWYAHDEQLMRDVASLPFPYPLGTPFKFRASIATDSTDSTTMLSSHDFDKTIPGICTINFVPTLGTGSNAYAPINVLARNIYTFVRHDQTGSVVFEAPDLMMYLMTMDSLNMLFHELKRAYGIARLYAVKNRYYGFALLESLGYDAQDIIDNLADFRYRINQFAYSLASLAVPANMPLFTRHAWMCSGLYLDGVGTKAQTYIFKPEAYYKFNNLGETGTSLSLMFPKGNGTNSGYTRNDVSQFISGLMNIVLNDNDFNVMSAAIYKAYGAGNLLTFETIGEDYVVLPEYDKEVLSQIENLETAGLPAMSWDEKKTIFTEWSITQNPNINAGYIQTHYNYVYELNINNAGVPRPHEYDNDHLINSHTESPTPDEIMVMTRLKHSVQLRKSSTAGKFMGTVDSVGSEFVLNLSVWSFSPQSDGSLPLTSSTVNTAYVGSKTSWTVTAAVFYMTQFDWHPLAIITSGNSKSTSYSLYFVGDLDNYTVADSSVVQHMHNVAMLSLLNVPQKASGK